MRKEVASAKSTSGQDGDGEDKVQDKRLCCWLKIHARDFSTDSKGPLKWWKIRFTVDAVHFISLLFILWKNACF